MAGKTPLRGEGRFQWNTGAWWGGQLGASCWMGVLAVMFLARGALEPGLAVLACFLGSNSVGFALWTKRHCLRPYPALQGLVAALFLFSLASLLVVLTAGRHGAVGLTPLSALASLLVYPGLMLLLALLERESRQGRKPPR